MEGFLVLVKLWVVLTGVVVIGGLLGVGFIALVVIGIEKISGKAAGEAAKK